MMERLQKYMAHCGVASRRKCEELIVAGRVKVNGKTENKLGFRIDTEKDIVQVDGKNINVVSKKVYIALNKPEGYLSTVKDERNRKTVLDIVKVDERIYPVGRLDCDTSGLLILTNDGDIYNKIVHPKFQKNKIYIAVVKGIPDNNDIYKFCNGIDIGGYVTSKAYLKLLRIGNNTSEIEIKIHEGKNRQIRKMCEEIGHPVITLKRTEIGNLKLGTLKAGEWRYLSKNEIDHILD
ncbi:MAG: rRNA pseudouridine synthase [Clostridium sp.]|jgi:23S rRNA pseudouridine2605 synthase|uniref:pseudouridine synthase n=1 Tax=Clostridium sp. TaxID=1506 RepID=UPI0025BFBFD5|nr:pseudouridine synthase [Clostridium sp.]MCH3963823.1 rRNA pseudouridine synthase [Clostridium sp.]MCI1716942.1 rRNA pseudouridine synthase [Clostridium sp.]MCI1801339.1 rRNA pseudouridine synthase [Clostridium sp.]MCI1815185.1 rRNA pseudouridine synthase [Clostridium sp.]MCI1872031.1 rRNA pseudouridine synthase [Clostridium sp.]